MNKKLLIGVIALAFTMIACDGSRGSHSTGGVYFNHEELADEFVYRLNIDVYGYDVSLVKANAVELDYIVVRDHDLRTYDAYYIGGYNVGENMNRYLNDYESFFYYDLTELTYGNLYESRTGILFDQVQENEKNLAEIQATVQSKVVGKIAKKLRERYTGLSVEQSEETATFAYNIETQPKGTYDFAYYDSFVKQTSGSTIDEWQNAFQSGEDAIADRVKLAESTSGRGSEVIADIFRDLTEI